MATLATHVPTATGRDDRFFFYATLAMTAVIICGFSLQLLMGRSSFGAPLLVHLHAIVFMGWVAIYLAQTILATTGGIALHRRLGWLGAAWIVPMVVLGCMVTVAMARRGHVPFFFQPLHFLVFDPLALFAFAGLTTAAIMLRRQTDWHRRLHLCGTALLTGPGFGRLLPMPLLAPYAYEATFAALMIFPAAGVIADLRRSGRVHPAWIWGIAVMVGSLALTNLVTYGPLGAPIYRAVTQGSPGANVAPLAFAPPPAGGMVTGRH